MLKLYKEKCDKCGKCKEKCPFGAIKMPEGYPEFSESCTECGACVRMCDKEALLRVEEVKQQTDIAAYRGFWVIGLEEDPENLNKITLELLSESKKLAQIKKEKVSLLIVGKKLSKGWKMQAASVGCDQILVVEGAVVPYNSDFLVHVIHQAIEKKRPEAVLFPATVNGRDLAPKIACRLRTGLTADCTGLRIDEQGNLVQIRPTYGGSVMASIITPGHRPQMASVRPNVMQIVKRKSNKIEVENLEISNKGVFDRTRFLKSIVKNSTFASLEDANIMIAGGYGLGSGENFEKLIRLCNKLNAAAAATRKVVDEGWAPSEIQVGQTGVTVAPDLYIAFGISGALQHTLGMKNAKKIIAINNNPAAPIFDICDVAILGDASAVLEECVKMTE